MSGRSRHPVRVRAGWGVLGAAFLAGAWLGASPGILRGDDPPAIPVEPPRVIELTAAKATPKGKGWEIEFSGKAGRAPEGTLVEFDLLFRTNPLRSFEMTIDASRQFREKREFEDLTGFAPDVYLRARIDFYKQPRNVQQEMEKDPEAFDLKRNPWGIIFYDQRVQLGSAEQIENQEKTVRGVFLDALKRALAAEKSFSTARAAAEAGTQFRKDGAFDAKEWQSAVEKDVREPLRVLQGELRAEKRSLRLLAHGRDLKYLTEIVNAVARRSYERSRSLYEKLGMTPDPADAAPRDIQIDCSQSSSSYLTKTTERLCESQGIDLAELSAG